MSCRAKTPIPGEPQCKLHGSLVRGGAEKEVKSAPDCVIRPQVCGVGREERAGAGDSFAGGADAAAAGDHQPERKIGLLWSRMLCASQCGASNAERDSQPGEGK